MKSTYDQIRQIPKIAGTVVVEANVSTETPQNVPDKALTAQAIGDIMFSYQRFSGPIERSVPGQ